MKIRPFMPTGTAISPMQLLIFIQLLEGPKYGYEILVNLRDDFAGSWDPKTGTIYPSLRSLVKKGYITEDVKKDVTYYSLTNQGREVIKDTKSIVRNYVLFNYQFMRAAAERLPVDFTLAMLSSLNELGIDDIIPEETILEALRRSLDKETRLASLTIRKETLLNKLKLIENELEDLKE